MKYIYMCVCVQTHVCVQQTVIDLLSRGFEVHVVADACSSRSQMDRMFALEVSKVESCLKGDFFLVPSHSHSDLVCIFFPF